MNASSSACQGSWLTNHQSGKDVHQSGKDVLANGKEYKWTYFVKMITPPDDAYSEAGFWYTADGVEIGPVIWGAYAKVQMVSNDKGYDEHGILYKSPTSPGLGYYNP